MCLSTICAIRHEDWSVCFGKHTYNYWFRIALVVFPGVFSQALNDPCSFSVQQSILAQCSMYIFPENFTTPLVFWLVQALWKWNIGLKSANLLTTNVPHHRETSQLICLANQINWPVSMWWETLLVNGLM